MSEYGRRRSRTKEPEYIETEDEYVARGTGARDLVLRPRQDDYDDYDDPSEYRRRSYREDYGGGVGRRSKSQRGARERDSYYDDDDYYSDYDARSRRGGGRSSRYDDDYEDDYDRPRERKKSTVEKLAGDVGLGGVVATVMKAAGGGRSRSRRRRSNSDGYSRSRSRGADNRKKWQQAAKAAAIAAAIEGVRSRNEAGPWTGPKGQRILTAALGAAGIDGFVNRNSDNKSKRHIAESVIGGLAANRLANGPRDSSNGGSRGRSMSRGGRSRSRSIVDRLRSRSRSVFGGRSASRARSDSRGRSQSRGPGIKQVAGLGAIAAAGKVLYDRVRSKSRGRVDRDRSRSASADSYVPSRKPRYAQQQERRNRGGGGATAGENTKRSRDSSTSSVSTTDLENQRRHTRSKELLTAGLATVASIHAVHGVVSSIQASEKRHKLVQEGEISPEQARKARSKNILQDVAAVGIAALGIKSAYGEWKEMNEQRREKHELEARHRRKRKARERRQKEGQGGGGYGGGQGYGPVAPVYNDANPYAYGNLPPPPVGGRM
ncbi:hypothetical protein BT63DRAFT_294207 [Microthyrium microscopicum]|uniref:DUF3824 domain-containing protein n=1 Tax=Microthyrium microscopicum TaxID=703497 RepID=A0A6A6U7F4_9PEZI|nr:hypothetical protein BT63DRAFT_294207 [Microthyrium microscopicum]